MVGVGPGPGGRRRSGPSSPPPSDDDRATDLLRARGALLAPPVGTRRLGPAALRGALVDLHDLWLASRASALGTGPGIALVAVGSLGRRELAPGSGLDLLVVHDGTRGPMAPGRVAEGLATPLRAARLGPAPPVRTVGEAVETGLGDLRAALALLEARPVAGDAELVDRLVTAVRRAWRAGAASRADDLAALTRHRWARSGDVAHRLEPDLVDGRGGLRDAVLLDALALAGAAGGPAVEVRAARATLLDLRTDLHRRAGRAGDVLRIEDDPDGSAGGEPGPDRHELARALSRAGRTVATATEAALRTARPAPARRGLAVLRRAPGRRPPLGEGVVEHAGEVTLARAARVARDPVLVLRLASAAARTGLPMAPAALRRLAEAAPELRAPWPEAARTELLALLGAGDGLVDVVDALDRADLWGRLLPEWGAVRDLPPGESRHVWTVDRHLVEVTARAAALTTRVARPDLLLLGALVHDLGRGRGADHTVVGATLAGHIGRRLGLPPADVDTLAAVVRHHRLLPGTARRRDPEDPATAARVVGALGDDPVLLEILHALAEADALGTGPGVWTPWLASLVDDLVGRCRPAPAGGSAPAPEELPGGPAPRVGSDEPVVSVGADGDLVVVTVAVPAVHRAGLLPDAAGVLSRHAMRIRSATLVEHGDTVVARFTVSSWTGRAPEASVLREDLLATRRAGPDAALRRAVRGRDDDAAAGVPAPGRVLWFDDAATGTVVLELRTVDGVGLLHRVAAALEAHGVGLRWARASTLGSSVIDLFGLSDPGAVLDPTRRRAVEVAVLAAATGAVAAPGPVAVPGGAARD